MVESKILTIIKKRLRQYKGKPINQEKLVKIREDIYKGTRKYKSAPFAIVKKWIKEARADMAAKKKKTSTKRQSKKKNVKKVSKSKTKKSSVKKKAKSKKKTIAARVKPTMPMPEPKVSQSVKRSLEEIKSELSSSAPAAAPSGNVEVSPRRAPMVLDKVYLQSMSFEMASMRQALDRIGLQLDKLERELSAHREGGE